MKAQVILLNCTHKDMHDLETFKKKIQINKQITDVSINVQKRFSKWFDSVLG